MDTPVIAMVLHAGWAARVVLIVLLLFSFATWTIIFNRLVFLRDAAGSNRAFRAYFKAVERLADIDESGKKFASSPLARLGLAAAAECRRIRSDANALAGTVRDASFFLQSQFAAAAERLESVFVGTAATLDKGVFLLAMVSSLSPFLGLLGTVWGIMNSFYEIGSQGSASLPVVAPGIAEALVATLAGLAVAIPALFFYNYFNHRSERMEGELDEFRQLLLSRLKRELLEGAAPSRRGTA